MDVTPGVGEYLSFKMPDKDIVIEACYTKTVGACLFKQQIANPDGTISGADSDFSATFTGMPRDSQTHAFYNADSVTLTGAKNGLGLYSGTKDVVMTLSPKAGYVVSSVKFVPKVNKNIDHSGKLERSGNVFTVPNTVIEKRWTGPNEGNGVSYYITVTYTKAHTLTVKQSVDGDILAGSSKEMAKLTLESRNDGTFIDGDTIMSKYVDTLTKGENSSEHTVQISDGNKITVGYRLYDDGRTLSELKAYETASGNPLTLTKKYQYFDYGSFEIDDPAGTDITLEAVYSTVNRVKVEIQKKGQTGESSMLKNDTDIYATVVGEGSSFTGLGYQFRVGSTKCNSFEVRKDTVLAETAGSTRLTIDVHGLEGTGYVVANVDARYMDSSGNPGASSGLIEARNELSDSYGTYLNFEHCTLTMPDRNMYIRIYLAKTTQVTVNFNSRMGGTETPFTPNQVSSSIIDMTYTAAVYGGGVRPMTITNAGNEYNGDSHTVTSNPSSRTVKLLEYSRVKGTVSIPDGYLIASVVTTRTNGTDTETVAYTASNCKYISGNGKSSGSQYEGTFILNAPVEYGWDYTVDVNIETVTKVKLEVYHSDQNGSFVLNSVTKSAAMLTGTRGGSDADSPYNQTAYQSSAPFAPMSGDKAGMSASITADKDHSTQEYYVLRHTAYTVTAIPVEGDEVYQVKAVNAAAQTQTYDVTPAGDDGSGHPTFTVGSLSEMGEEMIIRVYFTDPRAFGAVKVENYDAEGEPIALPASATMIMNVSHPIYLDEPAYDMQNGGAPVRNNVRITGATAHYRVTVGGKITLSLSWGEDYCLYSYKLRYRDGREEGPFYPGRNMYYELKPAVSDGSEVTVVNYFIRNASVNQEVYFSDADGNLTPKKRFPKSTDKFYSLYFDGALLINGSTPVAVSASGSGSVWNISSDYAVDNAVISVDVYYIPTYRVRYHGNGNESGSEPADTREYATGDILGTAEHPLADKGSLARRGFIFDGWSTESGDGNGAAKVTEITFRGMDIDLYAVWTPENPLHVTYDGNGNTSGTPPTDSEAYYNGETVTVLGRNGMEKTVDGVTYEFAGWNTDPSAAQALYREYDAAQQNADGRFNITSDITLYAVWLPQYHVTYHDALDTPPTDGHVYHSGDDVTVLGTAGAEKTFDGVTYRFDGWSLTENGAADYQPGAIFAIDSNTDLYAVWTAQYTVTYHGNGNTLGNAPEDTDNPYDSGAAVTVLDENDLKKTGHSFSGWSLTEDGTADYQPGATFVIDSDTDLYAVWTVNSPRVRYTLTVPDDVNFNVPEEMNHEYGTAVGVAPKPDETNYDTLKYTFHGWDTVSTDLNMNEAGTSFTMPDHDVEFTGYFTENGKVNLSYNANGGTPADKVPSSVSGYTRIETTVENLPEECVKKGHSFDHWNTAADGSGISYSKNDPITVEGGDAVLYAQWRKNSYPVEYYGLKNGEIGEKLLKQANYPYCGETDIGGVTLDVIPGKVFKKWTLVDASQKDADGQAIGERLSFPMPDETVAYRAVYDDLIYLVQYAYTGEIPSGAPALPVDGGAYSFGDSVPVASVPTLAGFTFDGWKLGEAKTAGFTIGENTPVTVSGTLTRTVTLTGAWVKNADVIITYTSGFTAENAPDDSLKFSGTDTCTKGMDYTLKSNSGFTNYIYPGYTFSGWKVVSETVMSNPTGLFSRLIRFFQKKTLAIGDVYGEGDAITALNSSITVEAVWTQNPPEPQKYRVTYDGNGATGGQAPADSHEYAEDDTPEVLGRNTLEKTDSQFNGWNTKADGSGEHYGEGDRLSGMKADVTLYAEWKDTAHEPDPEPQKFRVTYDGNGATGGNVPEDNTEYVMNQEVTVLQQGDLAKDGYTFKGWNTQADGKGTTYQPSGKFHINGNVTLYAMWTKNVDTPDHPGKPGNPGTGESVWLIVAAAAAMLLSLASVVAVLYRRRKG